MADERVVGIDLGTTNSEIAAFADNRVQVLDAQGQQMLPSCVGLSPEGALLVGETARRQQIAFPERTVRSIKRKMGSDESVRLGEESFSPQEISALILRELLARAEGRLGARPAAAVITVPAYFSDAQRQATREAGELAGLQVRRIINEPTAASLAYGHGGQEHELVMVYDLGGGTFDVSLVRLEGDVTEVLASHGNNHLGGDDFTQRLVDGLVEDFDREHGVDLRQESPAGYARLWWAAERAKQQLSAEPYATIREEHLLTREGAPLHMETELSRDAYDERIRDLAESTLESVTAAMTDANVSASDIDSIVLVGGATRTPLVADLLAERSGLTPRQEVHPDLCVALGAGVMASRLEGREVERVLVDVCPYSFGISHLEERDGFPYPHCYSPTIQRNTPLPVTRTRKYFTASPFQDAAEIEIYQGEDPDALNNIHVGEFRVEELTPMREPNELLCHMELDLNGILQVSAIEKATGKSKKITIENALQPKSEEELTAGRARLEALHDRRAADQAPDRSATGTEAASDVPADAPALALPARALQETHEAQEPQAPSAVPEAVAATPAEAGRETAPVAEQPALAVLLQEAETLTTRSRGAFEHMHEDDRQEAIALQEKIAAAAEQGDADTIRNTMEELRELLFFVEGAQ